MGQSGQMWSKSKSIQALEGKKFHLVFKVRNFIVNEIKDVSKSMDCSKVTNDRRTGRFGNKFYLKRLAHGPNRINGSKYPSNQQNTAWKWIYLSVRQKVLNTIKYV